jgi:ABC-type nitrate/sulfonate/bicarbonate transport system ATPase subunit
METPDTLIPALSARAVGKRFVAHGGLVVRALEDITLEVEDNSFVCIVGPSGCGKSTLLRILAGLERCDSGEALYRGAPQTRPRREIGVIFQEYSLFPWRTVGENVALAPEFAGRPAAECRSEARLYLKTVGLDAYEHAYPHELSGGMRQRVAIARALAGRPDVLLMDEPFGALDAYTRIRMQKRLLEIWERHKTTVVFVTHSVDEAVFLADRIVVMTSGPGRVMAELPVDLPRPRRRDDPRYAALTAGILDMLEGETRDE